jgi:hypothetical protein
MMEWWKDGMMGREESNQLANSLFAFTSQNSNIPLLQHSSWDKIADLKATPCVFS